MLQLGVHARTGAPEGQAAAADEHVAQPLHALHSEPSGDTATLAAGCLLHRQEVTGALHRC